MTMASTKKVRRPRSRKDRIAHARAIGERLEEAIPDPRCELDFQNPFQLLIATILSAQTTDKGVNKVTPVLFKRFPDAHALANAVPGTVETIIRSTGYYRAKTRHLLGTAKILVERHGGEVPKTMEALLELPGVARKTANVVLGTAFRIPSGVTIDTHASRVSQRLGLTRETQPVAIERELMDLYPPESWIQLGHRMVLHGRYTCTARAPACARCPLSPLCPSAGTA